METQQQGGVVVVGAINVDLVVSVERLPGPGETVVGPRLDQYGGGKGANAAVAAARMGAPVQLVAAVGADELGSGALSELTSEGINIDHVQRLDEPTGAAIIAVDQHGENQIAVGSGANAAISPDQVKAHVSSLAANAGCVLISTEIAPAAVAAAVRAAASAAVPTVLNPAPVIEVLASLVASVNVLTPNRTELIDLGHALGLQGSTEQLATAIAERCDAAVIVTLGADGALVAKPDGTATAIAARPATVVDTTGAGDTFNGVIAARLAAGIDLDEAVTTAVTAASLSVEHAGARSGIPTADALPVDQ